MRLEKSLPVVGIGASAGGVEAFEGFFRNMPADTGMAFVLVTHMPPGHETTLPDIIARHTSMPVSSIRQDEAVEPDHVYVCPAAYVVVIKDGLFKLSPRQSGTERKPIDLFLNSLALAASENAIGVVLSGGGRDGSLGIRAIKERGGLTLAQGADGTSPRQTSMPDAAVATGHVDLILPVEQMARRLAEFARSRHEDEVSDTADRSPAGVAKIPEIRRQIAQLLHVQVGHDFSGYKENSFMRRVRRRMQILQVADLHAYVERLRKEPEEVKQLFRDLLIGVTNFFRDQEAFDALEQQVVPKLFEGLGASDSVRIWVPGCATGEEAYSIAILAREHMETLRAIPNVQIFATDIDETALAIARRGRYPHALMENVTPERLARFFVRDDAAYTVSSELRDLCVFSLHSVLRDPPSSRIDLISCRNLLIYLGPEFQGRVIPIFHLALRPGGYLFLGTSESISHFGDLFQRIDNKQRLFQRRDHVASPSRFSSMAPEARARMSGIMKRGSAVTANSLRLAVENRVIERFAPPHVVVNRDGDIVYYSSRTGNYLEAAAGAPSQQLFASARRGLPLELRHAFEEVLETGRPAVRDGVAVEIGDRTQTIKITIEPLNVHDNESDPLFLVLFADVGPPQPEMTSGPRTEGDGRVAQLERELRDVRERLQTTVEEYEVSLEELKSANEEMISVNEELQSGNEELETSKEEMQSINEELQTVNAELNQNIEELDRANSDLRNLFESTQVGTIFLDQRLVIRSFTPAAASIFNLISTDRGRPLTDIVSRIDLGDFNRDIRTVLERGEIRERRVHRTDGTAHYLMRILPYRGRNSAIEGVIITFVDVNKIVETEQHQVTLVHELNHRVRNMLAVVSAMAQQTHANSKSSDEFISAFTARIQALAAAYNLVSREKWGGSRLNDVLSTIIEPYHQDGQDRITIEGPQVLIKPKGVLSLGLIMHELAANAAKHGALSKEHGRVSVRWKLTPADKRELVLSWLETNGPTGRKPRRRGFGSELIEREVKNTLHGVVKFDYAAHGGLEVMISLPVKPEIMSISE